MPTMTITQPGQKDCFPGKALGDYFTGDVHIEPVLTAETMSVGNVTFTPCARTNWHTHTGGQLLRVLVGNGWICDKGDKPRRIRAGDIIWCPPGTTHWHGADDNSYMTHQAASHGQALWHEAVSDEEYAKKD